MGPKNPCIQSGDNCFCFASSQVKGKHWSWKLVIIFKFKRKTGKMHFSLAKRTQCRCWALTATTSSSKLRRFWLNLHLKVWSMSTMLMSTYLTEIPCFTFQDELVKEIGVWTSGTFIRAIGTFAWASNLERFSFANWMYGSPMMSTFECVRMAPSASFQWQDIGCEQRLPYVCESTGNSTWFPIVQFSL